MMKKIILSVFAAASILACQTDDVQPSELTRERAFETPEDLKTGTFGIYSAANRTGEISFTARFTDESSVGFSNGGQGLELHAYNLNANTPEVSGIWLGNYNLINRANVLLDAAEGIEVDPDVDGQQAVYDEAVAEALFFRAYGHSVLLSYFGVDLRDRESLGVPIIDFVPTVDTKPDRNTVGEVFDFIFDDLDAAEQLFNSAQTPINRRFISADVVKALRARMAIYAGNADLAEQNVDALIGSDYNLPDVVNQMTFDNYNAMWEDINGGNPELIFEFGRTPNNAVGPSTIWNTNESSAAGAPLFELSRVVFNELEERFNMFGDIRRLRYVDDSSIISPDYDSETAPRQNDILIVDKYPGNEGFGEPRLNDVKVFRTAEMILIKAEANVLQGDLSGAADMIKVVQDARYQAQQPAPNYNSEQEAYADILSERRIELYGEGFRYIDIKRLGQLANQGYDRNDTDCSITVSPVCDLGSNDFRTQYLPIPFDEIRGNADIQQSPNY